ncbi:hypothetical protein ACHFI2_00880 [Exiguobacterium acetylicum]|uniref:hypothetical protein n=1 Tax=Exiguobacterium acetylicum TaxID=41170 RepID=UPI003875BFE8
MQSNFYLKNFVYIVIFSLISLILLFNSGKIVGDHFYYDSVTLNSFLNLPIKDNLNLIFESSYAATAFLYQLIGIDGNFTNNMQIFLNWSIFTMIIYVFLIKKNIYMNRLINLSFFLLLTLFYSVYLGQISKETIVVVMMFIVFLKKKYSLFLSILLMLLYGYFVRDYWLLVSCMFVANYFLLKKIKEKIVYKVFILNILMIVCISIIHITLFGSNLTNYRYQVNEYRMYDQDVNTILINPYNSVSILSDFGNFLFGLSNLLLPVDGLSSLNEIMYYVWILFLACLIILKLKKIKNKQEIFIPISILISFLMVQSIFEPDIGSILKHQIGLFPLYLNILNVEEEDD